RSEDMRSRSACGFSSTSVRDSTRCRFDGTRRDLPARQHFGDLRGGVAIETTDQVADRVGVLSVLSTASINHVYARFPRPRVPPAPAGRGGQPRANDRFLQADRVCLASAAASFVSYLNFAYWGPL